MVTDRKEAVTGRDAQGRFVPGHAGNGGRPRGATGIRTRIAVDIFAPETAEAAAAVLLALLDDPEARIRLEAARLALAYGLGRPRERVDIGLDLPPGVAGELRVLARLSVAELEAIVRGEADGDDT